MSIKDYRVWLIYLLGVILIGIGSFYDQAISAFLYDPASLYGQLVAAYGQIPMIWGLMCASLVAWRLLDDSLRGIVWKILIALLGFGCYIYGALAAWDIFQNWLCLLGAFLFMFSIPVGSFFLIRGVTRSQLWAFVRFTLFLCIVQFLVVLVLKEIWARPRFYLSKSTVQIPFVNWYEGPTLWRSKYMEALQIDSDAFKSFPSAHTACAACSLFLAAIGKVNRRLKNLEWPIILAALVFSILVGLGRIIAGAHYLSDVTFGFLITYTVFLISWNLFLVKRKGFAKKRT